MRFALREAFLQFWQNHPLLFFGLHLVIGAAFAISYDLSLLIPLSVLWIPFFLVKEARPLHHHIKILIGILLIFLSFAYTKILDPPATKDKMRGTGYFSITSLKLHPSPFKHSFVYKGTLHQFHSVTDERLSNIPCSIQIPKEKERPQANCDYIIDGTLMLKSPGHFTFKPSKRPWVKVPGTSSLAEWRYLSKDKVRSYLKKQITGAKACVFLTALATGDIDERLLSLEFGKLGMQHILAISGFHFAIISAFLALFLNILLPRQIAIPLLMFFLSLYFFFLGNNPSVLRAYLAIMAALLGHLLGQRSSGLNALGLGMIIALVIDPHIISHLGFQLSFLCTFAILLFYPLLEDLFSFLLPKRPLEITSKMDLFNQCGYILSTLLRKSLSLNFAVHLFTLPAILFCFHKFPLLSLAYNLFFPVWVTVSLLLLLTASLIDLALPPLGHLLHSLNNQFTSFILELTSTPPAILDFSIRLKTFPFPLLMLLLSILFVLAVLGKSRSLKSISSSSSEFFR